MSWRRTSLAVVAVCLWAPAARAQTRFYFDSTAPASVSPAVDTSDWTGGGTASPNRLRLNLTKQNSTITAFSVTETAAAPEFHLWAQFVRCGLDAQTIDGTIKGQLAPEESNLSLNATLAVRVAKSDSAGANVVEIVGVSAPDLLGSGNEFAATAANRSMKDVNESASITLASTAITAGDCLIVEVGFRDSSGTTSRIGYGYLGDTGSTDLPEDQTDTDITKTPWIEFSDAITFSGGATPGCAGSLLRMGAGC
jgi:hypothetical protein